MNQRMGHVFLGLAGLFVGIIAMLTWWQLLAAGDLQSKSYNNQRAWYEQRIRRGVIRSSDGIVLARNRAQPTANGEQVWIRRYPRGGLAAHAVGYSTIGKSRTGIERSHNDYLTGSTRGLASFLTRLNGNDTVTGDSLQLTLSARAQRVAREALGSRRGSVVAIEPRTGRILTLVSTPDYDPNLVDTAFGSISKATAAPLLDRATQALYPPGSTFKVITAAAALESGIPPDERFPGGCSVDVDSGPPVSNFGGSCAPAHDFTYALTNSVNTTFARLGDRLGQDKLRDMMERFGFFSRPELEDLPSGERRASGLYDGDRLLDEEAGVDAARVAIGQERLGVTPLQMAMVAATIANDGTQMRPYLVEKVITPTGRVERTATRRVIRRVIDATIAGQLSEMMQNVVREGSGTAAALDGINVAGKTGTADTPSGNQVWFIAFAPARNPRVAIAVTLERQPAGSTGGVVAAPIAHDVLQALL